MSAGTVRARSSELAGWRYPRLNPEPARVASPPSMIPRGVSFWRKALAFAGPGYLVAVGYMDPGNWATDLAGGARFGYTLLSVILLSNLMAILLQALALKLGIVDRARPGPGLPRPLLAAGELRALGAVRDRHRRLRPGRGDRLGHRAQPAVRHSAGLGRLPHRARRAAHPAAAAQGVPLPRGASSSRWSPPIGAASRSSWSWPGRTWPASLGGLVPTTADRHQPGDALHRDRHSRRHGDAAQPLPALVHRADPEGAARRRRPSARRSASPPSTPRWPCCSPSSSTPPS